MNTVKKIIAIITVAIIIIRTLAFEAFAFAGAPAMAAEEITTLLETALIGSGLYTESDLEGKSYLELNDLLKDGINSGHINPKTNYYTDPVSGMQFGLMDLLTKPEVQVAIGFTQAQAENFAKTYYDSTIGYWWNTDVLGENIYDKLNPTYNVPIDMQGKGGAYKIPFANSGTKVDGYEIWLFDYAEIVPYSDGSYYYRFHNVHRDVYRLNGSFWYSLGDSTVLSSDPKVGEERYGDWRFEDGTKFGTDDEPIPIIGEADGVQITPDMLNPDGTVTIDGTTYYPKDFIDLDKFKDPAIIDLLKQILDKIDSVPVAEPDTTKDLVDSITGSVSVPGELSDYIIPAGISSVFPFCLPFDLYRGIQLLSAKPVAPVLKIPFEVPEFGYFKGYKTVLTIDFEEYDKYFSVFRWGIYFIFALSLVFISTKIVKGAGA